MTALFILVKFNEYLKKSFLRKKKKKMIISEEERGKEKEGDRWIQKAYIKTCCQT